MVTMLDCIRRVAPLSEEILKNAQVNTDAMVRELGEDISKINELVICGSGSSNNAAVTAASFMEEVVHLFVIREGLVGKVTAIRGGFSDLLENAEFFPF